MKTTKPKWRPHRSHNRIPKLYRWADIGTEALIYFAIVFGPWAFGTVHDWAITTMNLTNYGIGLLLVTKWFIRLKTDYQPSRWTSQDQKNGESSHPKRDWRTKTAGFLTVYMLGYILISILNARSTYNWDFNFFEYEETYIKWIPHTYDKTATIKSFCNFLGLACCFWGIRDWLLGRTRKEKMDPYQPEEEEYSTLPIPTRLNRLLWLLCISGGLLALIGIIQRLDGTPKLLWILERERFGSSTQGFGPFGYRSNGASYLNMILPVCVGFLMQAMQKARSKSMQIGQKGGESHYTLIPAVCIMVSAQVISLSRGGFVVLVFLLLVGVLLILIKPSVTKGRQCLGITVLIVACIGVTYCIGWEQLLERFKSENSWHETQIEQPNTTETITYEAMLPPPPYDRPSQLFMITNSRYDKFRKGYLYSVLYMNGNLMIALCDDRTKSKINTTFTNLSEHLDKGKLTLRISRGVEGLTVLANKQQLFGTERSSGKNPHSWNYPVVPNEIHINKKTTIKTGAPDLKSRFITVHPTLNQKGTETDISGQSVEIDLTKSWSLAEIASLSSSRLRIYDDAFRMAKDFRWLGVGSGAWSTAYYLYHDEDEPWNAWAHCDWLEYWITFGLLGTIPGLTLLGLTVVGTRRQLGLPSIKWISMGLNLAIAGCLLHALFDFPLQVISIMHLFVILCAIKMVATVDRKATGKTHRT